MPTCARSAFGANPQVIVAEAQNGRPTSLSFCRVLSVSPPRAPYRRLDSRCQALSRRACDCARCLLLRRAATQLLASAAWARARRCAASARSSAQLFLERTEVIDGALAALLSGHHVLHHRPAGHGQVDARRRALPAPRGRHLLPVAADQVHHPGGALRRRQPGGARTRRVPARDDRASCPRRTSPSSTRCSRRARRSSTPS